MSESSEERFLKDVKDHQMAVIRDEGCNRHIRFSRPGSSTYHFDLITWCGHLCITGDCGTYVFSRLADMFRFFRTDRTESPEQGKQLFINDSYWGEKLKSICKNGGYREFSRELFEERVRDHYNEWVDSERPTEDDADELWEALETEVLGAMDDGEHYAYEAIMGFQFGEFSFVDFFDAGGTERYTFSYLWCLYAIAWGIQQYDEQQEKQEAGSEQSAGAL